MKYPPGAAATRRLFFALWPEPGMQHQLAMLAAAVQPPGAGRLVPAALLHATLLYLGPVTAAQQLCAERAADALRTGPFVVEIDRIGYFRRPQVLWAGCRQLPAALQKLVEGLRAGCAPCGFEVESRPFELHVTLVRQVRADPGRPPVMPIRWDVDRFALVESVNDGNGMSYLPLHFWRL